jgi:cyclopropane fatty-acyl-phospholipid synthase-like methyltransferase
MDSRKSTVLVDSYRKSAARSGGENSYKGLRIHALQGLHDFIAKLAKEYLPPGAVLLDLAAGTGAMSLRMQDLGFNVTATDYVPENFKLTTVPFAQSDLNENFSAAYAVLFDAIIASEIIEHLENPRHFARECNKLLAPGGRIILSTPNIESSASVASFLRSGCFAWFSDDDYVNQGHITPLSQWQMEKVFTEAGFKFLWKGSFGDGLRTTAGSPRLRFLAKALSIFSTKESTLRGEIFVCVLEKAEA